MIWLKTKFILESSLAKEEVIDRISHLCKTTQSPYMENEYDGSIFESDFEISRIISGRNSFKPSIKGNIETTDKLTTIRLTYSIPKAIQIFMGVWFGLIFITLFLLILQFTTDFKFTLSPFVSLSMLGFGYFISKHGFEKEVQVSNIDLLKLFEAKELK